MIVETISAVPFKFRAGEMHLGSVKRRLVTRNGSPYAEGRARFEAELEPDAVPAQADGILLRSAATDRRLPRIQLGARWVRYVPRQYERYFADLRSTYDDYLNSFSSKSRSTLRRKVRRFEKECGGTAWKRYQTPQDMEIFYAIAREVSRDSYQERLLDAGLPADEFFRQTMMEWAEAGNVRGYVAFVESRAAAYLYCPIHQGVVSYSYLGYRSEYERLSPGTVLLWLAIEDLFKEGCHRVFDFTEGGDADRHSQKKLFSTASVPCADIYFLRRSPQNLLLVLFHTAIEWLSESIGSLLQRMGVKRRVKLLARRLWHARGQEDGPASGETAGLPVNDE